MKNQRKILTAFIMLFTLILTVSLLTGCGFDEIYDDDEKIAKSDNNYVVTGFIAKNNDATFSASAKKFSGTYSLATFEVTKDLLCYNCSFTVTSGRFKLVAVNVSDEKVYVIFEGTGLASSQTYDLPNGKYEMKMVGDNAAFEMSFTFLGA